MFSPEANLFLGEVVKKLGSCVLAQVRGWGKAQPQGPGRRLTRLTTIVS